VLLVITGKEKRREEDGVSCDRKMPDRVEKGGSQEKKERTRQPKSDMEAQKGEEGGGIKLL